MKDMKKMVLKKINIHKNNELVKVLTCHCGCHGQVLPALGHGYQGNSYQG